MARLRMNSSKKYCGHSSREVQILANWGCEPNFKEHKVQQVAWRRPPMCWTKLNMDDTVSSSKAGYGGLLRDVDGKVSLTFHQPCPIQQVFLVELKGELMGLLAVVSKYGPCICLWLEMNSKLCVEWIKKKKMELLGWPTR